MRLWSARLWDSLRLRDAAGKSGDAQSSTGHHYDPAASRGLTEAWWLKANDPVGRRALWLKWAIWAGDRIPAKAVAEACAVAYDGDAGHVATKTAVPFTQASFERLTLGASVDGCVLSSRAAVGRVDSGGRSIAYDLSIEPLQDGLSLHASRRASACEPMPNMATPFPKARISGWVEVDAERWRVEAWPAMVGHHWGRPAARFVWGHCCDWEDGSDVVFEGASAVLRAGSLEGPTLTALLVRHRASTYALNDALTLVRNTSLATVRRWQFHGRGRGIEVVGELWADTDDFVGLFSTHPSGAMFEGLQSAVAHAELSVTMAGYARRALRSTRAALHLGSHGPSHGVRMYL